MDVSFQKDASLHEEVSSEEVCCFEGHDGSCQGQPIQWLWIEAKEVWLIEQYIKINNRRGV